MGGPETSGLLWTLEATCLAFLFVCVQVWQPQANTEGLALLFARLSFKTGLFTKARAHQLTRDPGVLSSASWL